MAVKTPPTSKQGLMFYSLLRDGTISAGIPAFKDLSNPKNLTIKTATYKKYAKGETKKTCLALIKPRQITKLPIIEHLPGQFTVNSGKIYGFTDGKNSNFEQVVEIRTYKELSKNEILLYLPVSETRCKVMPESTHVKKVNGTFLILEEKSVALVEFSGTTRKIYCARNPQGLLAIHSQKLN